MKNIEQQLKDIILSNYKSIMEFAIEISMPYSTIDSIFKRGISNASVTNIIKICTKLNISADMLAIGIIQSPIEKANLYNSDEAQLIKNYRLLTIEGQEKTIEYISDLLDIYKYKKNSNSDMGQNKHKNQY